MPANEMPGVTDPAQRGICVVFDMRQLGTRTASEDGTAVSAVPSAAPAARLRDEWHIYTYPWILRRPHPSRSASLPPHVSTHAPHEAVPLMLANAAGEAVLSRMQPTEEEGETWA